MHRDTNPVTVVDPDGHTLSEGVALSCALAAVKRKEIVRIGPATFMLRPGQDHKVTPNLTANQKRRIFLAKQRKD